MNDRVLNKVFQVQSAKRESLGSIYTVGFQSAILYTSYHRQPVHSLYIMRALYYNLRSEVLVDVIIQHKILLRRPLLCIGAHTERRRAHQGCTELDATYR